MAARSYTSLRATYHSPALMAGAGRPITETISTMLAHLQEAVNASGEVIFLTDRGGTFTFVNRQFERLYGYRSEEVVGRTTPRILKSGAMSADAYRSFWSRVRQGDTVEVEFANRTRDGRPLDVEATVSPIVDQSLEVVGFLAIQRDVSARRQAVGALQIAEERMRFAMQNAGVGTWEMDYATGVMKWSPLIEVHYGLQPGTFEGTFDAFVDRIHPDDRAGMLAVVKAAVKSGEDFRAEHRIIWPDGTVRWLLGAGRVQLGPDRQPIRAAGITWDLTQQKRLELDLRHSQKLESVGRLAAGVAHEINTPVQFVSDSLHFVKDALDDLTPLLRIQNELAALVLSERPSRELATEAVHRAEAIDLAYLVENLPKAVERALDGVQRVATIVRSMKEFAYPDARDMAPADLNRAVQSTLTIARNEYKYIADVKTELGDIPLVTCHLSDVNQVVLNIVVSAAHAIAGTVAGSDSRGLITVETRGDGDAVLIRISDTGTGIPEDVQDRIFDPFFTTKAVGTGTGQGLAIARSLITEKHQGELTFETEKGKGTTFIIRLPVDGRRCEPAAA